MTDQQDFLRWAAQLGVGGLLAALMFMVTWRYVTEQVKETKEDKKILIDLVAGISSVISRNTSASDGHTAVVNDIRAVVTDMRSAFQDIKKTTENNTEALNEIRRELASRRRN